MLGSGGPARHFVVTRGRYATKSISVSSDRVNLLQSATPCRHERDVTPVGRIGWTLVRPQAESQLAHFVGCQIQDLDVMSRSGPRGISDLVERGRGPRRSIAVSFVGKPAEPRAIGANDGVDAGVRAIGEAEPEVAHLRRQVPGVVVQRRAGADPGVRVQDGRANVLTDPLGRPRRAGFAYLGFRFGKSVSIPHLR